MNADSKSGGNKSGSDQEDSKSKSNMSRKSSRIKGSSAMNYSTISKARSGTECSQPNDCSSDHSSDNESDNADTVKSMSSNHSSEVDELKELEMRTGLVKTKVPAVRMPALKKASGSKVSKKHTLTFAESVVTSKKGGMSVCSQDLQ